MGNGGTLSAHAALAKEAGATPVLLEDGDILSLSPGRPEVIDSAPVGRLALDGNRVVPLNGGVLAARRRMLFNGVVLGSFASGRRRQDDGPGAGQCARPVRTRRSRERRVSRRSSTQAVNGLASAAAKG